MRVVALLVLAWSAVAVSAETFTARVIAVLDGDTVIVQERAKKTTVRLAGIDAPEKLQEFGLASRDALVALVLNKDVQITTKTVDDYGRVVALQAEAQQVRRGLWAGVAPTPPWAFRKTHGATYEMEAASNPCGKKRYCSQMVSCDEARFYLTQCRVKTLDKDGDGVPCESLCVPGQK